LLTFSTRRPSNPTSLVAKYFNKKTEYGGIRYDSKAEATYAQQLDLMRHARGKDRVDSWERQVRFPLIVNGIKICDYICDFLVRYADGRKELVEVKGFVTPEFRIKEKLFRATFLLDHPEINYTIHK
jgi:predicted nuclease of restriction endonuclease-like RecB superfamily